MLVRMCSLDDLKKKNESYEQHCSKYIVFHVCSITRQVKIYED